MSESNILQHRLLRYFWDIAGSVSIRVKVMGIVVGLVLLLGLGVTLQVRRVISTLMTTELEEKGVSTGRDISARSTDLVLINDLYELNSLLTDAKSHNQDILYAFVIDSQGAVIAHTFEGGFPLELLNVNLLNDDVEYQGTWLQTDEGEVWDVALPIFDKRAGTLRVGLTHKNIDSKVNTVSVQMMFMTILVSGLAILVASFLTWIVTRPILELVHITDDVKLGDMSKRANRWANDEIGDLAESFNLMMEALEGTDKLRTERELSRLQYIDGVINAQEHERKRISRELHDGTGQSLTSLLIGLTTLEEYFSSKNYDATLEQIKLLRHMLKQSLEEVRSLAFQLRPSILDDLGLCAALEKYIAETQKSYPFRIDLTIYGLNSTRIPTYIETALYRIVQESLTNIARHACAEMAGVLLEKRDNKILVYIEDDGCGFEINLDDVSHNHLGLYGIKERAELLGGEAKFESKLEVGTTIFVQIPLSNENLKI